ncbi:MAG: hypothetical protein Q8Q78_14335 [Hydrogenophaga sp.]|nr:hypothetical protein [Hydrogenophaga sp.]
MSYEPRRVLSNQVPLKLYARPSSVEPGTFDVITEDRCVVASNVTDLNCARLFTAAPMLMSALYEAQWWIRDQVGRNLEDFELVVSDEVPCSVGAEEVKADLHAPANTAHQLDPRVVRLLKMIDSAVSEGCTPSGLYPVAD